MSAEAHRESVRIMLLNKADALIQRAKGLVADIAVLHADPSQKYKGEHSVKIGEMLSEVRSINAQIRSTIEALRLYQPGMPIIESS